MNVDDVDSASKFTAHTKRLKSEPFKDKVIKTEAKAPVQNAPSDQKYDDNSEQKLNQKDLALVTCHVASTAPILYFRLLSVSANQTNTHNFYFYKHFC